MGKLTILIPAGGAGNRWGANYPKHLAQITPRETILDRLVRQFKGYGDIVILTEHLVINQMYLGQCWLPEKHRTLCETLMNTSHMWSTRNLVILGDVVFSDRYARYIATCPDNMRFLASNVDLFAVNFTDYVAHRWFKALRDAAVAAYSELGRGKLWEAYRMLNGTDITEHVLYIPNTEFTEDWTTDIDTVPEFSRFMDKVRKGDILLG